MLHKSTQRANAEPIIAELNETQAMIVQMIEVERHLSILS
jgi:hypothetical protein